MRKSYKSFQNKNDTIEVGPGHLKLLYSANEGKLTHYVNNENKVCYLAKSLSHVYYIRSLTFIQVLPQNLKPYHTKTRIDAVLRMLSLIVHFSLGTMLICI